MEAETENETCTFSLCAVGGKRNPVASRKPDRIDQGKEGFARLIREAKNASEIQKRTCSYFLASLRMKFPEYEEKVTTVIGNISKEELDNSVKRINEKWEKLSLEEDKSRIALERKRRALQHPTEDSSSSPKMAKMTQPLIGADKGAAGGSGSVESPENNIAVRSKTFLKVLKEEFQNLKGKLTRMSHPPPQFPDDNLKEFSVHNKRKIEKLQICLLTVDGHIQELEDMLKRTVLPADETPPKESTWFDFICDEDGEHVHHKLLVPKKMIPFVQKIYVSSHCSLEKYEELKNALEKKFPEEHAAFEIQLDIWKTNLQRREKMVTQKSSDSADTLQGIPPIQDDDGSQS